MANNCLQTTLKSIVNNDNLYKIGTLRLKVNQKSSIADLNNRAIIRAANSPITIKAVGNGYIGLSDSSVTSKEITISSLDVDTGIFVSNNDFFLEVSPKYAIKTLSFNGTNSLYELPFKEDLSGCDTMISLTSCVASGDIRYARYLTGLTAFTTQQYSANFLEGDVSNLKTLTGLNTLRLFNKTKVTGDLSSIGTLINLSILQIGGSGITGSLESFISKQIENGRNSVSYENAIRCDAILGNITFGGNLYPEYAFNTWVTWESANKIICYAGQSSSKDSYTHVVAKGATAEEIAAWEQAGKTVVVVN